MQRARDSRWFRRASLWTPLGLLLSLAACSPSESTAPRPADGGGGAGPGPGTGGDSAGPGTGGAGEGGQAGAPGAGQGGAGGGAAGGGGSGGGAQGPAVPPLPLSTRGRFIVDAAGHRVKLASVNWYGASDVHKVVGGLDIAPLADIVAAIRAVGFNSVRLPFANLILHDEAPVASEHVAANPELLGLTPLEVYDRVVAELTRQGILVILNNHTTHPMWCCNLDSDGLWYTDDYSEDRWLDDWSMMAARYRDNPRVIGADLRNEVRPASATVPRIPSWAAQPNDWRAAAERAGERVLAENPDLLVVVEGINFGSPLSPRPHLRPVFNDPIRLSVPRKLVYGAHNYGYIGPSEISGPRYGEMAWPEFQAQMHDEWGYVALDENRAYTAPVWVSEFGESMGQTNPAWFQNIIRYLQEGDFDWAYWAVNPGPKPSGDDETYALLERDWRTPLSDFRIPLLQGILAPQRGPGVDPAFGARPEHHFDTLLYSDWDTNQSTSRDDWSPAAYKATCDDAARLVGASTGLRIGQRYAHAALCSGFALAPRSARGTALLTTGGDVGAVNAHTGGRDWAPGYLKTECAVGEAVVGLSQTQDLLDHAIAGVLCAPGPAFVAAGGACQSVIADDADDRRSPAGGDWDSGHSKAQCGDREYVAGVSLSGDMLHSLLCCPGL
jgi:endoglucanase